MPLPSQSIWACGLELQLPGEGESAVCEAVLRRRVPKETAREKETVIGGFISFREARLFVHGPFCKGS